MKQGEEDELTARLSGIEPECPHCGGTDFLDVEETATYINSCRWYGGDCGACFAVSNKPPECFESHLNINKNGREER